MYPYKSSIDDDSIVTWLRALQTSVTVSFTYQISSLRSHSIFSYCFVIQSKLHFLNTAKSVVPLEVWIFGILSLFSSDSLSVNCSFFWNCSACFIVYLVVFHHYTWNSFLQQVINARKITIFLIIHRFAGLFNAGTIKPKPLLMDFS